MKKLLFLFTCILSLASCMEVGFKEPMPPNATNINAFPDNLQGTFVNKTGEDTLVVSATGVSQDAFQLDENNVLRSYGKYYVVNKKKQGRWQVALIKPCGKNGFRLYTFDISDAKNREALNKILPVEEVLDADGDLDYLLVAPDEKQFQKLVKSRCLDKTDKFHRISN